MQWDILQVLLLIYISIFLPLRLCLGIDVTPADTSFYIDIMADLLFCADLITNFRTAYIDENGVRGERPEKIRKHYLHTWFLVCCCQAIRARSILFRAE